MWLFLICSPLRDNIEGAEHGFPFRGECQFPPAVADFEAVTILACDDEDAVIEVVNVPISFYGGPPSLEFREFLATLASVFQNRFVLCQFCRGCRCVAGGTNSSDANYIDPVGMLELVHVADFLLPAEFAIFIFVLFKSFVLLQVDTCNPRPVSLWASWSVFEEAVHDHTAIRTVFSGTFSRISAWQILPTLLLLPLAFRCLCGNE